jgi:hypothetical protein
MLIDCPHCYTRVIPKADGCCPACQNDTRDVAGLDTSRTTIRVSQGDILPPICCECGQYTSRVVSIHKKTGPRDEGPTLLGAAVLWVFFRSLGARLLLRAAGSTLVVNVTMPQCDACAEG